MKDINIATVVVGERIEEKPCVGLIQDDWILVDSKEELVIHVLSRQQQINTLYEDDKNVIYFRVRNREDLSLVEEKEYRGGSQAHWDYHELLGEAKRSRRLRR